MILVAALTAGLGCSRKKEKPEITGIAAKVDANNSSISVVAGPVPADGTTEAEVTITFLDSLGEPVSGVVPVFTASPTPGITAGVCPATDADGVSVCTLTSTLAESKTVKIVFPIQKVGNAVAFEAGPAARLCIQHQPGGGVAGVVWSEQPRVLVGDSHCNLVSSATNSVTMNLAGSLGVLNGTSTVAASSGVATFTDLNINESGSKFLTATAAGLSTGTTASFVISGGPATALAFHQQPGGGTVGAVWNQQPVIHLLDSFGNLASSANHTVGLMMETGTGAISGAVSRSAISGVASFSGLSLSTVGAKTIRAMTLSGGTFSVVSQSFNITAGAAAKLAFSTAPGGGTAGVVWSQQPVVQVQDVAGNIVTSGSHNIALTITTGTGALNGVAARYSVSGEAAFAGLSMMTAGSDKVMTASAPGLTSAVSSPAFGIVPNIPSANQSSFSGSPITIFARGTLATSALSGVLRDAYSNPISGRSVSASSDFAQTLFVDGTTAVTNALGQFSFTVGSGTAAVATITASVPTDSVTLDERPVITFESFVASLAHSSWSFAPVTVAADGSSTATLNVVLRNNLGTALPGKSVTLVSSRGGTDMITSSPSVTNAGGVVTMSLRSATRGEPTFTIASSDDSLDLTTQARLLFYDVAPVADWQAQLANSSVNTMGPGLNSPATTLWRDLYNLGPNNGLLTNIGATSVSGWCGNGMGTVGSCATGAYRLMLDGANDYVNFGTGLNSFAHRTHEIWMRTVSPTDRGELVLSNGDANHRGLALRQAWDGSGNIELTVGGSRSYPGEIWADAPIGYYRFDSGVGVTVGTANVGTNLTYLNMGTTGVAGGLQDPGTSIYLGGSNSYGDAGNVYPASANMTISALIYTGSVTGTRTIASKGNASSGYALELNAGRLRMRSRNSLPATQTVTGATTLSVNTWYHVAGVRDAANLTMKVYVNGVEDGSVAVTNAVTSLSTSFAVGRNSAGSYFMGRIDELAIFNTALPAERIAAQAAARHQHTCYSLAPATAGSWRQVAATFDDNSKDLSLYVNGALQCTRPATGYNIGGSTYPLTIGVEVDDTHAPNAPYFNGMYGDIRIYDQALSAGQLLNNYNTTSGRFP